MVTINSSDTTKTQAKVSLPQCTSFLDLPAELRIQIYEEVYKEIQIIKAYNLNQPVHLAYFATGNPFTLLNAHPQLRAEWRDLLPVAENVRIAVQSLPIDQYKRALPFLKCDDETIVTPLEKIFTPQMTIEFNSALSEAACAQKQPHEVQLDRLTQVRELLRCAEKLFLGLEYITFIGNMGRETLVQAPANPGTIPLHEDVNKTNPHEHQTRLKAKGGPKPFHEHAGWKSCLEQLQSWEGGRIKTVGFEPGFWSLNKTEENKIVRSFNKRYQREDGGLAFVIENPNEAAAP